VLDRGGLATRDVGYNGQHKASEARRSARRNPSHQPSASLALSTFVEAPGRDIPEDRRRIEALLRESLSGTLPRSSTI
jgi:hypothetical protein